MAQFQAAPLPSLGSLFDPAELGGGYPAPLPVFATLFNPVNARTLTADYGAFTLSGQVASPKAARFVTAAQGSFAMTGEDATLTAGTVTGGVGGIAPLPTLSSLFEALATTYALFASTGTFSLSGTASLNKGWTLTADYGTFTATFPDGTCDMEMSSVYGTFAVTGEDSTLTRTSPGITAAAGSFTLTPQNVNLYYSGAVGAALFTLFGEPGIFTLTGEDAAFGSLTYVLTAEKGAFEMNGEPARLVAVHWTPVDTTASTWTNVTASTTTWTTQ